MTEDRLSGLFDEIRKESAQTSISEVDQWIDAAVVTGATVGLLATLKLVLIKKPLIMWTTLVTITGGASLGVVMIFSKPEPKQKQIEKEVTSYSAPVTKTESYQKEAALTEPVEQESPRLEEPIRQSDSENTMPEDLASSLPVRSVRFDRNMGIPAHSKVQTTESFTKIHVSGALYVELSQGKSCSVEVEPGNASDLVSIEVQSGTLYLKNAPNKKERKEKVVVKVCVEELKELHMSGATSLLTINQLGVDALSLDADGASNVNLNLKATKLTGDFSGASNVEIAGTCESANLDISGASQARLSDFELKKVSVDNSGAAQVDLLISEELNVDASGASSMTYKVHSGSSRIRVDINTSGAAQVKKKS